MASSTLDNRDNSNNFVVDFSWGKLQMTLCARRALITCVQAVALFVLLFVDMSYSVFSGLFSLVHPIVWFVELSIAVLLIFQLISNGLLLLRYFWAYLFGSVVNVTEDQRRLMAIPINDRRFCTPTKTNESGQTGSPLTYNYSPNYSSADISISPHRSSGSFTSQWSNRYQSQTPPSMLTRMSPHGRLLANSSFNSSFNSSSLNSTFGNSLNASGMSQSSGRYDFDKSSLRSRRSASVPVSSRRAKYSHITDVDTLHRYISEEEEREINRSQASPDNLSTGNISFWSYGWNPLDLSHMLKRFVYQLAPRSAAAPTSSSSSDQISSRGVGEVWKKYDVTEDDLYIWTEKLRKWLSFTIISRLNAEVDEVNVTLQKIGCEDTQIGEVGVSTLKQLALTRGSYISTLNAIVPYLDLTANQEYLRSRIKDLSTGCMSSFTWDKGGNHGKQWSEHLPTDAALVMHLFCCYLDSRLPAQPKYPDGKSFTAQHFVKTPDKPNTDKDDPQIYQSSINPPHFQVVIGSQIYNLSKGRNNMFQAILLFLYHIKVKENGMLGRVNLGMSGLNMLWIFD